MIEEAFRGVEVLGLALADDPAAEGDDPALPVEDGEDDALAEAVIKAALGPGRQEPHVLAHLQGNAPALEVAP